MVEENNFCNKYCYFTYYIINTITNIGMSDKIDQFVIRLQRIGIDVKLSGNLPWIYISEINGKRVTEKFKGNHGFTIAFMPIKLGQELEFTDITKIFKLLRKYCK